MSEALWKIEFEDGSFFLITMKSIGRHQPYESEFAKFINEFKRQHPDIEIKQREARAMWWDKPPLDLEEMEHERISEVKLKPCVYD